MLQECRGVVPDAGRQSVEACNDEDVTLCEGVRERCRQVGTQFVHRDGDHRHADDCPETVDVL